MEPMSGFCGVHPRTMMEPPAFAAADEAAAGALAWGVVVAEEPHADATRAKAAIEAAAKWRGRARMYAS